MNKIFCPSCKAEIEISEALKHQIEEDVLKAANSKHKEEINKLREQIQQEAAQKVKEELDFKLKDSQNELLEAKEQNRELREQLLELNKSLRELRAQSEKQLLENERKLNEEMAKIKEEVSKNEQEKSELVIAEMKKQLEDTKKALLDAQRKATQGSQQSQGEILEVEFESQLRNQFPNDDIVPVPKGVEGADLWQKVYYRPGQYVGSIVWEMKRTKNWDKKWLPKLREDGRKIGTGTVVLVSETLPDGIDQFGLIDRVWVTSFKYAISLACVLRVGLIQVAAAKSTAEHKDKKLEALYGYLTNDIFRGRFEALVESIVELQQDLETEKRTTMRLWKKKEMQITRLINNSSYMYGELQGIIGSALPTIKGLDNPLLDSGGEILNELSSRKTTHISDTATVDDSEPQTLL